MTLKELRLSKNMTQVQVAQMVKISLVHINNMKMMKIRKIPLNIIIFSMS